MYTPTELAWCAGFFDGEGNVSVSSPNPTRKDGSEYVAPRVAIKNTNLTCLDRFRKAIGELGRIRDVPKAQDHYKDCWVFVITDFEGTQQLMCLLWPYLEEAKRNQFRNSLLCSRHSVRKHQPNSRRRSL